MSASTWNLISYVVRTGVPHRVTSVDRPGDPGRHGKGLAVDFAGLAPFNEQRSEPNLLAIFEAFKPVEHLLYELIYSGAPHNIKAGRRVSRYAVSSHWNHVHVSLDSGVLLPLPTPQGAMPMPTDNADLPNIGELFGFYPIVASDGRCTGYYFVSKSGEVHGHGPGAVFHGRSEVV